MSLLPLTFVRITRHSRSSDDKQPRRSLPRNDLRLHSCQFIAIASILLSLISCSSFLLQSHASPAPAYPFTPVTTPLYTVPDLTNAGRFFSYFDVTQPAALMGTLAFAVAPFSGPLFTVDSNSSTSFLPFRLVLPHSQDDRFACNPLTRAVNDEGDAMAGAVLLIERQGGCTFAAKALNAAAIGAKAIVFHGCPTTPPYSCRPTLSIVLASGNFNIPFLYLGTADGYVLRNYLLARRDYYRLANISNPTLSQQQQMMDLSNSSASINIRVRATGPLVPSERQALYNLLGTGGLVEDTSKLSSSSSLRPWTLAQADPSNSLDPCINRMVGIYCENGHIVAIYLSTLSISGSFNAAIGSFSRLRALTVSNNPSLGGALPPEICTLTALEVLDISQSAFTSFPTCFSTSLSSLIALYGASNRLVALPPSLGSLGYSLRILSLSSNSLKGNPADVAAISNLTQVWDLELAANPSFGATLSSSLPSFKNFVNLDTLSLSRTGLTGVFDPAAFDGLANLVTLDISYNSIRGALPALRGAVQLVTLQMSYNAFESSIPDTWSDLTAVKVADLQHNSIRSPITALRSLINMNSLLLSYNNISNIYNDTTVSPATLVKMDVGSLLAAIASNNLLSLALDHNALSGTWDIGTFTVNNAAKLLVLNLANNGITTIETELLQLTTIQTLDLSNNALSSIVFFGAPSSALQNLLLSGNPALSYYPLPSFFSLGTDEVSVRDSPYTCKEVVCPTSPLLRISVDPAFTRYTGCSCTSGYFGSAPYCSSIPITATLSSYAAAASLEVGPQFDRMIAAGIGAVYENPPNGTSIAYPLGFSDAYYGNKRLSTGVDTNFVIDQRKVFKDISNSNNNEVILDLIEQKRSTGVVSVTYPTYTRNLSPVRVITIYFHLSLQYFTSVSDRLEIYEGNEDLKGVRVRTLLGNDIYPMVSSSNPAPAYASTLAYQQRYGSYLAQLGANVSIVAVQVFSNQATIHFQSRQMSSMLFYATFDYGFLCPDSYMLLPITDASSKPNFPSQNRNNGSSTTLAPIEMKCGARPMDYPSVFTIGLVLPSTGSESASGASVRLGAEFCLRDMALPGQAVLPAGHRIELIFNDSATSSGVAVRVALSQILNQGVVGIIGEILSSNTISVTSAASAYQVPIIAPISTSPLLSNKELYPYFLRPVSSDAVQARAMYTLAIRLGWRKAILVSAQSAAPFVQALQDLSQSQVVYTDATKTSSSRLSFTESINFQSNDKRSVAYAIDDIEASNTRLIFLLCGTADFWVFMSAIEAAGLLGSYQFIGMDGFMYSGVIDAAQENGYDPASVTRWLNGFLGTSFHTPVTEKSESLYQDCLTYNRLNAEANGYSVGCADPALLFGYDALLMYAYGIRNTMNTGANIQGATLFKNIAMKLTGVNASTGTLSIDASGDRSVSTVLYDVINFRNNSFDIVGDWSARSDGDALSESNISLQRKLLFRGGVADPPPDSIIVIPASAPTGSIVSIGALACIFASGVAGFLLLLFLFRQQQGKINSEQNWRKKLGFELIEEFVFSLVEIIDIGSDWNASISIVFHGISADDSFAIAYLTAIITSTCSYLFCTRNRFRKVYIIIKELRSGKARVRDPTSATMIYKKLSAEDFSIRIADLNRKIWTVKATSASLIFQTLPFLVLHVLYLNQIGIDPYKQRQVFFGVLMTCLVLGNKIAKVLTLGQLQQELNHVMCLSFNDNYVAPTHAKGGRSGSAAHNQRGKELQEAMRSGSYSANGNSNGSHTNGKSLDTISETETSACPTFAAVAPSPRSAAAGRVNGSSGMISHARRNVRFADEEVAVTVHTAPGMSAAMPASPQSPSSSATATSPVAQSPRAIGLSGGEQPAASFANRLKFQLHAMKLVKEQQGPTSPTCGNAATSRSVTTATTEATPFSPSGTAL